MNDFQVIKSMRDTNKLLDLGNKIVKIDRDRNNRDYLIFLFENNEKLQKDLQKISK